MVILRNNYPESVAYLQSALRLLKAGKRDGAYEMYLRINHSPEVLHVDSSSWYYTVDDIQHEINVVCAEACRDLSGILPIKFIGKYLTQDMVLGLLDAMFEESDSYKEVSELIAAREKHYLG